MPVERILTFQALKNVFKSITWPIEFKAFLRVLESRGPEEEASEEGVPGVPRSILVCVE